MSLTTKVLMSALMLSMATAAPAEEVVKIGLIATFSGPPAAIGQQIRNGMELALKQLDGKIGGRKAELIILDDELKPDVAVTKVNALIERDKVDFVIGPVFSNVLQAIIKPVTDADTILISPNPGTSNFAGKACNPNFFVTSIQNDSGTEAMGEFANRNSIDNVIAVVPNYQAGRDMVSGFKSTFKGELVDEIYVPLNQLDFSAELSRISIEQPKAIFAFLPGGMGVNFVKQFAQAGLSGKIKVMSVFTADEVALPALGDAALGILAGTHWTPDIDNERNNVFVAAYERVHNAIPASFAANGYDTVMLIDAAITTLNGDASDTEAVRKAMEDVEFKSLRGNFKFNTNHYPIQDILVSEVKKRADGKYQTSVLETVYTNHPDSYVGDCKMAK